LEKQSGYDALKKWHAAMKARPATAKALAI
jgi:glutathione S-transferase